MRNLTLNTTMLDMSSNPTYSNCRKHDDSPWGIKFAIFILMIHFIAIGMVTGMMLCAATYRVRWSEAMRKEYYDVLDRQGMPGLAKTVFKSRCGLRRLETEGWTKESQEAFNAVRMAYDQTVIEMKKFEKTRGRGSKSIFDADCNPVLPNADPV